MATALGKFSAIMSELSTIKCLFTRDSADRTTVHVTGIPSTSVDVGKCTPTLSPKCERNKDVLEDKVFASSQPKDLKQTTPQQVEGTRADSLGPPLTNQGEGSSHSARKNGGGDTGNPAQSPLAKIGHTSPRLRTLPIESRLAVARPPPACKERGPKFGTAVGAPPAQRDNPPPGYVNISDFECTSDSDDTVPILKPRKSHVSSPNSWPPMFTPCNNAPKV